MKNTTKIWLAAAGALVLAGCILFVWVMSTLQWDFAKLSTAKYETNTYEIGEAFHNIRVTTDTAHIKFVLSDDGKCTVECYEEEKAKHSVAVEGDALVIKINDQKEWYDYIGLFFGAPSITVYLPQTAYGTLSIDEKTGNVEVPRDFTFESADISLTTGSADFGASTSGSVRIGTSTGDINVEGISAGSIDLTVTTGAVTVSGVTCRDDMRVGVSTGRAALTDISSGNVISGGTTGSISLRNAIAANRLSIVRSTGNVNFIGCDAAEIYVQTDTGDVTGSLLTDKVFITQTSTGRIDVPKTTTGGTCEIRTITGDIKIGQESSE